MVTMLWIIGTIGCKFLPNWYSSVGCRGEKHQLFSFLEVLIMALGT
jgi:hypothetical protein